MEKQTYTHTRKKNKLGGLTLHNFKIYSKSTVDKIMWCCFRDKLTSGKEQSPEIDHM